MDLIADILLIAGALGAGFYCIVLSRRLSKFTDLEKGVGGAIALLSNQVEGMTKALAEARRATSSSAQSLESLTDRADGVAQRLELLVASMHDLPLDPGSQKQTEEQWAEDDEDPLQFQSQRVKKKRRAG